MQIFDGRWFSARALGGVATAVTALDSHGVASVDFGKYPSSGGSAGPRQSVALEGIALHTLAPGMSYDAEAHAPNFAFPYGGGTPGCFGDHALAGSGVPALGNASFAARAEGAAPLGVGLLALGDVQLLEGADVLGLDLLQHVDPLAPGLSTSLVFADAAGGADIPLPIPNDAQLAGVTAYAQVLWAWPTGPCQPTASGFSSSNGLGVTLVP